MKYKEVACGKQRMHWLALQFVDENNNPVSGLNVQLEYHPRAMAAELALWAEADTLSLTHTAAPTCRCH
ncbi:hypothetical protein ACULNC_10270 [Shigella flexneri]